MSSPGVAASAAAFGMSLGIKEFIASVTTPARSAVVPPLLVSVSATDGLVPVPPGHPEITGFLARNRSQGRPQVYQTARSSPGPRDPGPGLAVTGAWLLQAPYYHQAAARLAGAGQRLLTPGFCLRPAIAL